MERDTAFDGGISFYGYGECKLKCPYHLDTPTLLKKNFADYKELLAGNVNVN